MLLSIIIPILTENKYFKDLIESLPSKIKSNYELIVLDWPESVNEKWNKWVKKAKWDYIFVLNDDIVLTEWIDLELIKVLETNKVACPFSTVGRYKFNLPLRKANKDNIVGWCFMMERKNWVPIDERLKIWYWDNWIYETQLKDIWYAWLVHHYESQTLKTLDVKKILNRDKLYWNIICDEKWWNINF